MRFGDISSEGTITPLPSDFSISGQVQGDVIYFLSDFDLGDIPHMLIKSGDITAAAMSNLELLQLKVAQVINSVTDAGFDLLNASERQLCQFFDISRGSLRHHFNWINPLLDNLYNNLIQCFNENLVSLTDSHDLEIIALWAGVTEVFLAEQIPIKEFLAGIFEFFAEHIPNYLHCHVLARLSEQAKHKLFSNLALLAL
jgi:hypothetical protein